MRNGTEAIVLAFATFVAFLAAAMASDDLFRAHAWVLFFVLAASTIVLLRRVEFAPAGVASATQRHLRLYGRCHPFRRDRHNVLGCCRLSGWRRYCSTTRLALVEHRAMVQFRPPSPCSHFRGDLCLRWQCVDLHIALCGSKNMPGAPVRRQSRLVCLLGVSALHRYGGYRLPAGIDPVQGICGTGMVCRLCG